MHHCPALSCCSESQGTLNPKVTLSGRMFEAAKVITHVLLFAVKTEFAH